MSASRKFRASHAPPPEGEEKKRKLVERPQILVFGVRMPGLLPDEIDAFHSKINDIRETRTSPPSKNPRSDMEQWRADMRSSNSASAHRCTVRRRGKVAAMPVGPRREAK